MLDHVADDLLVNHVGIMLCGNDERRDAQWSVSLVFEGHLCLAVGPKVGERAVLADLTETTGQPVGHVGRERHEDWCVVAREAEREPLIASAKARNFDET